MEEEKKETGKRLKETDWLVICSLWERGEFTLRDLSEKFEISEAAISQGLKRRGIKRGSKAHLVHKEIEHKVKEERDKTIEEIFTFKRRFLRYGDLLMNMTMNEIAEAKKAEKKLSTIKPELDTIIAATKIYKTIRNDMFHLYDLYNKENHIEDELEFNIGVYSENDIEALRESQEILASMMKEDAAEDDEDLDFEGDND